MENRKKVILHVEDDEETRKLVKDILANGTEVVSAKNGKEGLEKAKELHPDLVLLDIMMPDMSGWDVYQKLKKNGNKSKVAFLTVIECSRSRMKQLKKEGVSDYIVKPFIADDLSSRIKRILKSNFSLLLI